MRQIFTCLILILIAATSAVAEQFQYDSSTAFYEGQTAAYTIPPPYGFKMVINEASENGYSFAFIPDGERYALASRTISVTFYSLDQIGDGPSLEKLVTSDTAEIRRFYSGTVTIRSVDSISNASGELLSCFYVNDTARFVPTVMVSYYDGGTEVLIFELSVSDNYPRFKAEQTYVDCIADFKVLPKKELGMNSDTETASP